MNNQQTDSSSSIIVTAILGLMAVTLIFSAPYLIWNTLHLVSVV
jgi:hypothetical protein